MSQVCLEDIGFIIVLQARSSLNFLDIVRLVMNLLNIRSCQKAEYQTLKKSRAETKISLYHYIKNKDYNMLDPWTKLISWTIDQT